MPDALIKVVYKEVKTPKYNWHMFTSNQVPGLFVASTNVKEAYEDIPQSIELLMRLNEQVECTVEPEVDIVEFLKRLKSKPRDYSELKFCML